MREEYGIYNFRIHVTSKLIVLSFHSFNYKQCYFYVFDLDMDILRMKRLNWLPDVFMFNERICYTSMGIYKQKLHLIDLDFNEVGLFSNYKDLKSVLFCDVRLNRMYYVLTGAQLNMHTINGKKLLMSLPLSRSRGEDGQVATIEDKYFVCSQSYLYVVKKDETTGLKYVHCFDMWGTSLFVRMIKVFNKYKNYDFYNEEFFFYNEDCKVRRTL